MKYKKILSAVFLIPVLFSGCSFGTSIDNLMSPPKLSLEQEQIYSALTDATGTSISLKYPKSGKYLSAFIIEDIDGDGGNEAVVFYEKTSLAVEENTLRINILDKDENDEKWRSVYDTPADGTEIEKVIISKLGENQRINLIIGSSYINRSEKSVSVYNYDNGNFAKTFTDSYSFIDVSDLDKDSQNEFLVLTGATANSRALAVAYKLDSEGKYHKYSRELSGNFTEFDNISYGDIGEGKTGLYIDSASGMGMIQSDVIYMDSSGLHKIFSSPDESSATLRPAGCTSFDVDRDGMPEIPVQVIFPNYEGVSESEQMKQTNWLYINKNKKLEAKYYSYYSINNGYIFIFPDKWKDCVTVKRDAVNDEIVFCSYTEGSVGRELLRIYCAEDAVTRDDRIYTGYMLLKTKGESSYLAYIPKSADNSDGLSLTAGDVAVGFRFME